MALKLPELPYNFSDLEPSMSRDALWFHYSHHRHGHFDTILCNLKDLDIARMSTEQVLQATARSMSLRALHRDIAAHISHNLYWQSMRPGGGGRPKGPIEELIRRTYGDHESFAIQFERAAMALYGNGWLWVTHHGGALHIKTTRNNSTPLLSGHTILLALDLWEHAYYLDHQSRRMSYVSSFLEDLVNWDFANHNLSNITDVSASPQELKKVYVGVASSPTA